MNSFWTRNSQGKCTIGRESKQDPFPLVLLIRRQGHGHKGLSWSQNHKCYRPISAVPQERPQQTWSPISLLLFLGRAPASQISCSCIASKNSLVPAHLPNTELREKRVSEWLRGCVWAQGPSGKTTRVSLQLSELWLQQGITGESWMMENHYPAHRVNYPPTQLAFSRAGGHTLIGTKREDFCRKRGKWEILAKRNSYDRITISWQKYKFYPVHTLLLWASSWSSCGKFSL